MYQVVVQMNDLIIHNKKMTVREWVRVREEFMIKDELKWVSHRACGEGLKLKFVETWKGRRYKITTEMR